MYDSTLDQPNKSEEAYGNMQKKQPEVTISLPPPHSDIQRKIMSSFLDPNGPSEVFVSCGTKFGKACHIDTPILTTKGWRNFGDLIEGDFVFTEHGKRTEVEFVTDTMHNHKCYEVVFSDGNKIIADAEHVWVTTTHAARKNMARAKSEKRLVQIHSLQTRVSDHRRNCRDS